MILGDRVRLRRLEREDLPRVVDWLNDPEVRDNLANVYPFSRVHEQQWFEGMLKMEPAAQPFVIEARGPRRRWIHIGGISFHVVDWRNRWAEVGIFIGRKDYGERGSEPTPSGRSSAGPSPS